MLMPLRWAYTLKTLPILVVGLTFVRLLAGLILHTDSGGSVGLVVVFVLVSHPLGQELQPCAN